MLLAVDVGNTQTVLGLFEGEHLAERRRLGTEAERTGDELAVLLRGLFDLDGLEGICLASTVPALVRSYEDFADRWVETPLLVVGPGTRTVVDFGTSTNFDVVSPQGEYVGGVLAPGVEVSMDALFARAARLFRVDFSEPPTVIGKTTAAALQSGLVYGFAGQVDAIVERIREELGADAPAIATGGLADLIAPHSRTIAKIDAFLTLEGLRLVWRRNAAPA